MEYERPIEQYIKHDWQKRGGINYHLAPDQQLSVPAGTPDIIGCYHGIFLAIEVKTLTRQHYPKPNQLKQCYRLAKAGALVIISNDKYVMNTIDQLINNNICIKHQLTLHANSKFFTDTNLCSRWWHSEQGLRTWQIKAAN